MTAIEGGCACGAVRYKLLSTPDNAVWCHCRTCQLVSASPGLAFAAVPSCDFVFTQGAEKMRPIRLSNFAERAFCSDCGTPLTYRHDEYPDVVDFTLISLDDPEMVKPGAHVFCRSRISWAELSDELPRYETSRTSSDLAQS